jgi:hypothetical protein
MLKVPSLDIWKAVLREGKTGLMRTISVPGALTQKGVAPKRETGVGEIKQRYHEGDHPRTMLTLPREITREGMRG